MKLNLTNEENILLLKLIKKIKIFPSKDTKLFCEQIKNISLELPENIKNEFINFKKNGSKNGVLFLNINLLNNEDLVITPSTNNLNIGETSELSKIQAILMSIMGELVSYEAEANGSLFQDIIPLKSMSNNQTSTGSKFELEIHTEQAFSKLRPDIISLCCLRGDVNAMTYILPIDCIINNMTSYEIELLKKPLWKTSVDLSFKLNGINFKEGDIRGPFPIIQGTNENPILVFDQDLMFGINEESNTLINKVVDIYYKYRVSYNLKPGDIIFIDNNRAVHGRSPYSPKFNGEDRFLVRCFLVFDYNRISDACDKKYNMISAIYS
jgi:L-asparagine oxygenase